NPTVQRRGPQRSTNFPAQGDRRAATAKPAPTAPPRTLGPIPRSGPIMGASAATANNCSIDQDMTSVSRTVNTMWRPSTTPEPLDGRAPDEGPFPSEQVWPESEPSEPRFRRTMRAPPGL